jgi:hypothetical protein
LQPPENDSDCLGGTIWFLHFRHDVEVFRNFPEQALEASSWHHNIPMCLNRQLIGEDEDCIE